VPDSASGLKGLQLRNASIAHHEERGGLVTCYRFGLRGQKHWTLDEVRTKGVLRVNIRKRHAGRVLHNGRDVTFPVDRAPGTSHRAWTRRLGPAPTGHTIDVKPKNPKSERARSHPVRSPRNM